MRPANVLALSGHSFYNRGGCALEGTALRCWGQVASGWADVPADGPWAQVSVGGVGGCVRRVTDGRAVCWRESGQMATPPPDEPFVDVCAVDQGGCGRRADGTLACWGSRNPPSGNFRSLDCKVATACGVLMDGTLRCWGPEPRIVNPVPSGNDFDEVRVGHLLACARRATGEAVCWSDNSTYVPPAGDRFERLWVGSSYACGRLSGGTGFKCWGSGYAYESQ
jgi:hypothetical protein